jgi:hypothetical protein
MYETLKSSNAQNRNSLLPMPLLSLSLAGALLPTLMRLHANPPTTPSVHASLEEACSISNGDGA